jgi:hypothetical protein
MHGDMMKNILQHKRLWDILRTEWVKPEAPATPLGYRKRAASTSGSGAIPLFPKKAPEMGPFSF